MWSRAFLAGALFSAPKNTLGLWEDPVRKVWALAFLAWAFLSIKNGIPDPKLEV